MKNYDHKQFIEWLNGELDKQEQIDDKLLVEKKLSKYWKKRAARRAKKAGRNWPNSRDRKWALEEQDISEKMNEKIHTYFQKELEESEEMLGEVDKIIKNIKKKREEARIKKEKVELEHPAIATARRKKGKSLSVPLHPERGVSKGYLKKSKKLGGATIAPGEAFGPMEESKEKSNENN